MLQFKVTSISVHASPTPTAGKWGVESTTTTPRMGSLCRALHFACRDPRARAGGGLEPCHCGSSCLLASRRGWDRHSRVKPGPSLSVLPVWEGRFREESRAFQVVVPRCGLVHRALAIWPARAQKEEVVEEREGKEEREDEEGASRRYRGPTRLAGTEASPIHISQAASLCHWPHLPPGQLVGRAHGRLWAPLLTQSGPACGPAGVGTVTVAKCADLCHCPQARGSHGDWLI